MLQIAIIAALGYGGVVATLYFAQGWLIFPGSTWPAGDAQGPLLADKVELEVEPGVTLGGHLFRSEGARELVIGFGGNAQDAYFLGQDLAARLPNSHVAVFHYRGYGPSSGEPGETVLLQDAIAIHDHLVDRLEPERVLVVGVSLGSAVATWLSSQRRLDGMLLVTPFDSILAIARENYPWAPVSLLLRHRFSSIDFITGNATPTAVISAGEDRVVRPERTQALIQRLENLVYRATIDDAAHNTILAYEEYDAAFAAAIRALTGEGAATPALLGMN